MSEQDERKISVDEGWKAKVEAEREALQAQEQEQVQREEDQRPPLPTPDFATLITNFASQALLALGRMPDASGQTREVDLELARYAIDLLEVVQTKTAGNLEPDEEQMLGSILHDLRMAFLDTSRTVQAGPAPGTTPGHQGNAPDGQPPDAGGRSGRIITP
ncbi:MAG: DUF1844 domain-containing protein [Candidatus Eiseniibacteriota bacterium]|jgi:hypothetical protein